MAFDVFDYSSPAKTAPASPATTFQGNVQNILALADHIERLPSWRLNMRYYGKKGLLGFSGCIAGHAYSLARPEKLNAMPSGHICRRDNIFYVARCYLGLSDRQAAVLFSVRPQVTRKRAARVLRTLAHTGVVAW